MELRLFQILVPLLAVIFVISQTARHFKGKTTLFETIVINLFWIGVAVFALIPDVISNFIADAFGIKSNINAILFLSIGFILFFQFRLYNMIKEQEKAITTLTQELALRDFEKKE
ncbi:MAG: DUF2304 domain-containing protein [Saprospiraceae bacterium]|nr:DUF2304 domain-containing protein [Saprospiraceae bacterium]